MMVNFLKNNLPPCPLIDFLVCSCFQVLAFIPPTANEIDVLGNSDELCQSLSHFYWPSPLTKNGGKEYISATTQPDYKRVALVT